MAGILSNGVRRFEHSRVCSDASCVVHGMECGSDFEAKCVGCTKYFHLAMYYRHRFALAEMSFECGNDSGFFPGDIGVARQCISGVKGLCKDGRGVSAQTGVVDDVFVGVVKNGGEFGGIHKRLCECGSDTCVRGACSTGNIESTIDESLGTTFQEKKSGSDSFRTSQKVNGGFRSDSVAPVATNGSGEFGVEICVPRGMNVEEKENPDDTTVKSVGYESGVAESKLERNRRWRAERKQLKKKRQFMNKDWRIRNDSSVTEGLHDSSSLRKSLEEKWRVQNELAAEKARRELEVLKANDLEQEVKQYRTKVSAATERNMVSIEKTHARLRQTGNLPTEHSGGFAETVISEVPGLDSGSGTISPDSSASMAEFRACQKALLDSEAKNAEYERKIKIAIEKYGFPLEQVDYLDKEVWTDTQSNEAILDDIYPNGYGKDTSLFEDGKFRAIRV